MYCMDSKGRKLQQDSQVCEQFDCRTKRNQGETKLGVVCLLVHHQSAVSAKQAAGENCYQQSYLAANTMYRTN